MRTPRLGEVDQFALVPPLEESSFKLKPIWLKSLTLNHYKELPFIYYKYNMDKSNILNEAGSFSNL